MRLITRVYNAVLNGAAAIAGALLVAMMAVICLDVTLRNLLLPSSSHLFTFTEYALLFVTMLGAPWLMRQKGHVFVEVVVESLPPGPRRVLLRAVAAVSVVACAILAWAALGITIDNFLRAEKDVRSMDFPRWILMASMVFGFTMLAVECVRYVVGRETMHDAAEKTFD
ncbi:MAG: TRAP transporter small permease [Proteobacteria bacterium]|nr:TRAP transporter small permease [Pseudomonadota bacterium]